MNSPKKTIQNFHRNLPQKARISIFGGKKELENFINDSDGNPGSLRTSLIKKSININNKKNEEYLLGCESIYEKFSIKKIRPSCYTLNDHSNQGGSTVLSLKRIK